MSLAGRGVPQSANLIFQRELRLSVANVSVYGDCVFQQMEMPAAERGSQQRAWANRRSSSYLPGQNSKLNPAPELSKTIQSQA